MKDQTLVERVLHKEREPGSKPRGEVLRVGITSLSRVPPVRWVHPWLRADKTDMRWLPINEDIAVPPNTSVPLALLDTMIEETSHRVVFEACGCRTACQCERYPHEIGCILMGDSAVESPSSVSREVGIGEAKEHARRAVEAGLVPQIGKARVDNFIFGIKDRSRLLTACFCCECCCLTRYARHIPVKHLERMFPSLDGASVVIDDKCDGCGDCVEHCYVNAIKMKGKMAVITDKCRACGRCSTICPRDAVRISVDDEMFLQKSYERIRAHVKHD